MHRPDRRARRRILPRLCALTWGTHYALDGDQAVVNLCISCSNKRSKNSGAVRDNTMRGLLFFISTAETTARMVSPFLKKSPGIWFSRHHHFIVFVVNEEDFALQIWYTSAETTSPTRSLYFW